MKEKSLEKNQEFLFYHFCRHHNHCEQDSGKWLFECETDVISNCRNRNIKTAMFHFFTYFTLPKSLLFHFKPWISKIHEVIIFCVKRSFTVKNSQMLLQNSFGSFLRKYCFL